MKEINIGILGFGTVGAGVVEGIQKNGALMAETPIIFEDRRWGTSKINAKEARAAIVIIFRLGIKNWLSRVRL